MWDNFEADPEKENGILRSHADHKALEELEGAPWDPDLAAALEDIISIGASGRNLLVLRVTCAWSTEKDSFDPVWEFLDAADEFTPRSGHCGRLLRSVRIPNELEADAMQILPDLDARIIAADPKLAAIAKLIGQATHVAVGEGPGSARLNTLPPAVEEMLQRTGIVLRNETLRPWSATR